MNRNAFVLLALLAVGGAAAAMFLLGDDDESTRTSIERGAEESGLEPVEDDVTVRRESAAPTPETRPGTGRVEGRTTDVAVANAAGLLKRLGVDPRRVRPLDLAAVRAGTWNLSTLRDPVLERPLTIAEVAKALQDESADEWQRAALILCATWAEGSDDAFLEVVARFAPADFDADAPAHSPGGHLVTSRALALYLRAPDVLAEQWIRDVVFDQQPFGQISGAKQIALSLAFAGSARGAERARAILGAEELEDALAEFMWSCVTLDDFGESDRAFDTGAGVVLGGVCLAAPRITDASARSRVVELCRPAGDDVVAGQKLANGLTAALAAADTVAIREVLDTAWRPDRMLIQWVDRALRTASSCRELGMVLRRSVTERNDTTRRTMIHRMAERVADRQYRGVMSLDEERATTESVMATIERLPRETPERDVARRILARSSDPAHRAKASELE